MTSPAPEDADNPHGGRKTVQTIVKIGFGVAVLAFGVWFIASRWSDLRAALDEARPGWIVAAFAFGALGQWVAARSFRAVLAATARWLPMVDVSRVYFVSQLGKYIPGSVWSIVAVTEMCRRYDISRRAAAAAGIVSLLFSLVTGGVVGIALVLVGTAGSSARLWWLILLVPVAVAAVHPRVIGPLINLATKLTRRPRIEIDLRGSIMRPALGWAGLSWVLLGLQCWALVVALGGSPWRSLAPAVGGFALAYVAGVLFVPAPAGAGVREAVLTVALAPVIHGASSFSHDSVIVVVLLSRVVLAILDFGQAGVAILVARHRSAPTDS